MIVAIDHGELLRREAVRVGDRVVDEALRLADRRSTRPQAAAPPRRARRGPESSRSSARAVADQPRQQPGDAVLGDQSAARERRRELRVRRGEADVAVERLDQAEAGGGAVDRRDHRLADGQRVRPRPRTVAQRGVRGGLGERAELEVAQVGAGAEAAPGARDDDRPDLGVVLGLVEPGVVALLERVRPGVQPLGAVEREHEHGTAPLGEHEVGGCQGGHVRRLSFRRGPRRPGRPALRDARRARRGGG